MPDLDKRLDDALANDNRDRNLAFLAGLLVGLGPVVATMQRWGDFVASPAFLGLSMGVIGGLIGTLFVSKRRNEAITGLFREMRSTLREIKE